MVPFCSFGPVILSFSCYQLLPVSHSFSPATPIFPFFVVTKCPSSTVHHIICFDCLCYICFGLLGKLKSVLITSFEQC